MADPGTINDQFHDSFDGQKDFDDVPTDGVSSYLDTFVAIGEGLLIVGVAAVGLYFFGSFLGPLVSENVFFQGLFNVWVYVMPFSMVMEMVGAPPHRSWWESLAVGLVNTLLWPVLWVYRMSLAATSRAFALSGSARDKVQALKDFRNANRSDLGYWGKRAKDKLNGRVLQWNGPSKEAMQHVQATLNDPACSGEFIEDSLF